MGMITTEIYFMIAKDQLKLKPNLIFFCVREVAIPTVY